MDENENVVNKKARHKIKSMQCCKIVTHMSLCDCDNLVVVVQYNYKNLNKCCTNCVPQIRKYSAGYL